MRMRTISVRISDFTSRSSQHSRSDVFVYENTFFDNNRKAITAMHACTVKPSRIASIDLFLAFKAKRRLWVLSLRLSIERGWTGLYSIRFCYIIFQVYNNSESISIHNILSVSVEHKMRFVYSFMLNVANIAYCTY